MGSRAIQSKQYFSFNFLFSEDSQTISKLEISSSKTISAYGTTWTHVGLNYFKVCGLGGLVQTVKIEFLQEIINSL